ncbi:MAG: hypothetical protein MUE44_20700 [Oscillatoriaceae cyanobacterium Prado104]|jgi:hypothetical protein|nr:hypothetical protein [Oscillatoriaceae cyanobacterium Prado104]
MQSIIELDLFFMQQGKVYQTLENLKDKLSRDGIDYAVIGGMALTIHGYVLNKLCRNLTDRLMMN